MSNKPIGVFDSGVGGLTVLKRLAEELPNENYLYFGDTARVPYGEKTKEQLIDIAKEILDWYKSKDAKAVIMACNTSSAVALDDIKNDYKFPIFGLIQPTAEYVAYSNAEKIGVLATTATITSQAYSKAINKLNPDIEVIETACPGLVEIVESNKIDTYEAKKLVIKYLMPLLEKKVNKIILGCTHYPYLKGIINTLTNDNEMLIDPAEHLAIRVAEDLMVLDILNDSDEGKREYYVSSNAPMFAEVGKNFYADCKDVQKISLAEAIKI